MFKHKGLWRQGFSVVLSAVLIASSTSFSSVSEASQILPFITQHPTAYSLMTEEALASSPVSALWETISQWRLNTRILSLVGARTSSGGGIASLQEQLNIQLSDVKVEPLEANTPLTKAEQLVQSSVEKLIKNKPELGHKRTYFYWINAGPSQAYAYARRFLIKKIGLDRNTFESLAAIRYSDTESEDRRLAAQWWSDSIIRHEVSHTHRPASILISLAVLVAAALFFWSMPTLSPIDWRFPELIKIQMLAYQTQTMFSAFGAAFTVLGVAIPFVLDWGDEKDQIIEDIDGVQDFYKTYPNSRAPMRAVENVGAELGIRQKTYFATLKEIAQDYQRGAIEAGFAKRRKLLWAAFWSRLFGSRTIPLVPSNADLLRDAIDSGDTSVIASLIEGLTPHEITEIFDAQASSLDGGGAYVIIINRSEPSVRYAGRFYVVSTPGDPVPQLHVGGKPIPVKGSARDYDFYVLPDPVTPKPAARKIVFIDAQAYNRTHTPGILETLEKEGYDVRLAPTPEEVDWSHVKDSVYITDRTGLQRAANAIDRKAHIFMVVTHPEDREDRRLGSIGIISDWTKVSDSLNTHYHREEQGHYIHADARSLGVTIGENYRQFLVIRRGA